MARNRNNKSPGFFRDRTWNSTAELNNFAYSHYCDRLCELAISMFDWKNLPDSIDSRFLELTLYEKGWAVFFKDEYGLGFLALPCTISGGWNVYREPIYRRAFASNGYNAELSIDNSVIIWNNMLRKNSKSAVEYYAYKLWCLDRIIDVNANAQKTPVLLTGSEQQQLSLKNIYEKYDGNEPVIFGDKNLDIKGITCLSTQAPYVCDKIYQLKTQIWNEAMTQLGISNLNIQKKERLVSDEVIRSQGGTIASRYSRLEMRREAAEKINAMFGLNIEVDYREDFREADDETIFPGESGGGGLVDQVIDLRTK